MTDIVTHPEAAATVAEPLCQAPELEPFPGRGARRADLDAELTAFYTEESAALDEGRADDWLALLAEPFVYQVPVPLLREDPALPRHSERAMLFEATKKIFAMKLGRAGLQHAWSDRPAAATRHFVGAVRVFALDRPRLLRVDCNVLATLARGHETALAVAARHDVVVRGSDGLRLLRRRVLLDAEVSTHAQLSLIF
ncbi:aromatic-ring-hydroxylating dioxygenase subunit beta [Streptomyces sp. NPDC048278]|uniref:aromatic-ring-hydroxylating dioxygenase subunit beta n=1 Tax=Streptomyces sp. NPDC048278 TaxID=3155809 RepID=UPI003445DCEE